MNEAIGYFIGWTLVAAVLWSMLVTLHAIYRELGFVCLQGFLWALAVVIGNLFGVVLFRYFRLPVERVCATLFEKR